jgi:hypothetical protein
MGEGEEEVEDYEGCIYEEQEAQEGGRTRCHRDYNKFKRL